MELQVIQNKIYEIRGRKVMLDRDLAELYGVETRALNQSVKRNMDRFPKDFMFQLTRLEWETMKSQIVMTKDEDLKSQNVTSSWGGIRKMPYAFTELGVAMLSSVLNSKAAIQVNMGIMRAFVTIRQLVLNPLPVDDRVMQLEYEIKKLKKYVEEVFTDYNDINEDTRTQLELINQSLAELQAKKQIEEKPRRRIGFRTSRDEDKNQ